MTDNLGNLNEAKARKVIDLMFEEPCEYSDGDHCIRCERYSESKGFLEGLAQGRSEREKEMPRKPGACLECNQAIEIIDNGFYKTTIRAEENRRREVESELTAERERGKALVGAVNRILTQFKVIQMHQHRLLVREQDLESASKNWDEATEGMVIDFEQLIKASAAYQEGEKKP